MNKITMLDKLHVLRTDLLVLDEAVRGQQRKYSDPDIANVLRSTHMLVQLLEAGAFDKHFKEYA